MFPPKTHSPGSSACGAGLPRGKATAAAPASEASPEILRAKEALQKDMPTWQSRAKALANIFGLRIGMKALVGLVLTLPALAQPRQLRVCADPDNLPFSNRRQQGFENRIAELLTRAMHARLSYEWQRMGRGFVREYLGNSRCDMLIGIPANFRQVLTTRPYYQSTYVFVSRRRGRIHPANLNDPALHHMKVGVQILDEDYAPPAHALARRGMQANVVGFETTGSEAPSIIRAVAAGQVDTAVVWGPQAGYFAQRFPGRLALTPVQPEVDPPGLPFTYAISMGVGQGNVLLRDELQHFLATHQRQIEAILRRYGVPIIADQVSAARGN